MNLYRIDWPALVDRPLVVELAAAVGLDPVPMLAEIRPVVARILEMTGGWPYVTQRPGRETQREFGRRLLAEAFAHAVGPAPRQVPGLRIEPSSRGMRAIETIPRIEVNVASATELAQCPGLTSRLAAAIVTARLSGGPLSSLADLVARVEGIGPARVKKMAPGLGFTPPTAQRPAATGDLAADLRTLVQSEPPGELKARLVRVLERVAMQVALDRHPRTRQQRARSPNPIAPPEGVTTERVLLLPGRQYYYHVKRAIRSAHSRVDLAMFHIAMPGRDHPTRQLLEALAAARDRGVRIRILVDRDRPDDPYGSVVINAPAIRFLRDAGVPVRVDAPQRLMHSKLIVIDADRTIVGSHNWSAGSYFAFDDLSVEVVSAEFARQARRRFGELWRRGKSPPRSR